MPPIAVTASAGWCGALLHYTIPQRQAAADEADGRGVGRVDQGGVADNVSVAVGDWNRDALSDVVAVLGPDVRRRAFDGRTLAELTGG